MTEVYEKLPSDTERRIRVISDKLKIDLGLIEEPRYSWSCFPHWKGKISEAGRDEAQSLKLEYLLELKDSSEMKQVLVENNIPSLLKLELGETKRLGYELKQCKRDYSNVFKEYVDFAFECRENFKAVVNNLKSGDVNQAIRDILTLLNHDSRFISLLQDKDEGISIELDEPHPDQYRDLVIEMQNFLRDVLTLLEVGESYDAKSLILLKLSDDRFKVINELDEPNERLYSQKIFKTTDDIGKGIPVKLFPDDEDIKITKDKLAELMEQYIKQHNKIENVAFYSDSDIDPKPLIHNVNPTQPNPDTEEIRQIQDQVVKSCEEEYKAYLEWKKTRA